MQESFTTEMLGSVADHWYRMLENYIPGSVWSTRQMAQNVLRAVAEGKQIRITLRQAYPIQSRNLEIKTCLPKDGVQSLFTRARAIEIRNGRIDA